MSDFRIEKDLLGAKEIPVSSYSGIHAFRALENFALSRRSVHPELIKAYGSVKLASLRTNASLGCWSIESPKFTAMEQACIELQEGRLSEHIIVDALQGGAGTSTNMNVNEVIANRALELLGEEKGRADVVSPIDDINLHQSTNDTYPTALKVAGLRMLQKLEGEVVGLQEAFQKKELEFADVVKIARTELQEAVLITLGREMSAYAEAFSRDRWRIYQCQERLRVVNLGGTAVGTGLGAPRDYIFRVVDLLRDITGLGLARAENLIDNTQNADVFVEVSGILKACAANLLKVSSDLRLLSSGPRAGIAEIILPEMQAGSSIMPGKVNPVIPEAVSQAALMVMANDQCIAQAAGMGCLELNQFLPLIADCFLESIELLANSASILAKRCVEGIRVNIERCKLTVSSSTAVATALVEVLGYEKVCSLVSQSLASGSSLEELVVSGGLLSRSEFDHLISAESINKLGSSRSDG